MEIFYYSKVDSTNIIAKKEAIKKNDFWVIANEQINGYGKMQRKFHSPNNGNIYATYVTKIKTSGYCNTELISIISGISLVKSIKKVLNIQVQLKWVNDLIYRDKKVGGILIESFPIKNNLCIVIGIGINLISPKIYNGAKIGGLYKCFDKSKKTKLLDDITKSLPYYLQRNDINWIEQYNSMNYLLNKYVKIKSYSNEYIGKVIGYTDKGHILISTRNKTFELCSGEVDKIYW